MAGSSRILLKLAASDLSLKELRDFAQGIERVGAHEMLNVIEELRERSRSWEGKSLRSPRSAWSDQYPEDDVVFRIEKMLIHEMGLLKSQAASILLEAMKSEGALPANFPELNRESFSSWLGKIIRYTSSSEVLHFVEKLRRKGAGDSKSSAWPLRPKDD